MPWLLTRIGSALVTYLLATTLIFFLMRLTPGDPLSRLSEDRPMPPEAIADLRARYGLDRPLLEQYRRFLGAAFAGNLGGSIAQNGRAVTSLIGERLPATLILGTTTLLLAFTLGTWLGVWQALRHGSRADAVLSVLGLTAYATPTFWLGLVLAWVFGIELHLLPTGFMHDVLLAHDAGWATRTLDLLRHLILPATTLSTALIAATARYQRAAMIDALELASVRTARVKGLPESSIVWRHAWRNALGPMLALAGLWLPLLVGGSVFVEAVFSWPGLGRMAWEAIGARDYPVIMGAALLVSALVVLGNLLADLAHRWLDPRLRAA
ncbi:MAG TPA: ABC transporter permease [Gemmatimonadales bacterium]|nr:ABC transporter permease [Gemmatimonadales bacterium]